jgi:hypothetical protein
VAEGHDLNAISYWKITDVGVGDAESDLRSKLAIVIPLSSVIYDALAHLVLMHHHFGGRHIRFEALLLVVVLACELEPSCVLRRSRTKYLSPSCHPTGP